MGKIPCMPKELTCKSTGVISCTYILRFQGSTHNPKPRLSCPGQLRADNTVTRTDITVTWHLPPTYAVGPGHHDVEGGSSMPEEQRIHFWTDTNVPINIKERLSGQLIEVYIQLDNLVKFVELNHDGFRSVQASYCLYVFKMKASYFRFISFICL